MRRLPSLTKSQRRALLTIEWVLLIGIVGFALRTWTEEGLMARGVKEQQSRRDAPYKQFVYDIKEEPLEVFPFDPNTADSTALLRLGLSPWQVRSIYRYRARHGRWHSPEDFMYLPGLTVEQWERLSPYIRIDPKFRFVEPKPRRLPRYEKKEEVVIEEKEPVATSDTPRDTLRRSEKLMPGQTVDIATADTSQLKLIPGIASRRAARIVAYRRALGGFVSVEQAMEACEMPDSVLQYMTLSPAEPRKINVNKLSVSQLMKHPYLSFYQAKAIFEHRRNKGELHSADDLSGLEGFRQTDIDRLRPYIIFE